MSVKEILGKKITNIWLWQQMEIGGLDQAEVFVELDQDLIIGIPYTLSGDIWIKALDKEVFSIFGPSPKSRPSSNLLQKFLKFLKQIFSYSTDSNSNNIHSLKNQEIVDILIFNNEDSGFLELANACFISDNVLAPHGTGAAGLVFFPSLSKLEARKGKNYKRLSNYLDQA